MSSATKTEHGAEALSIVVVSWRSAASLPALTQSILGHLGSEPELVIVENGSGEDLTAIAASYPGRANVLELRDRAGFGAACNAGVAACTRPSTVLLNPDCELRDAGLTALARVAADRQALVGPRLVNSDGSPQPSASGSPAGLWPWLGALIPGRVQPGTIVAHTEPWRLDRPAEVGWLTGACIVAPRDVLVGLGPFDPAIELYGEDLDLCLRARARGVPSLFRPDLCSVAHVGGTSTSLAFDPVERARRVAVNRRAVLRRAFGARREARSWRALRLNLALRAAAKAMTGDGEQERIELAATRAARDVPVLPAPPEPG
jgi:GT2 family glycosyltransferase